MGGTLCKRTAAYRLLHFSNEDLLSRRVGGALIGIDSEESRSRIRPVRVAFRNQIISRLPCRIEIYNFDIWYRPNLTTVFPGKVRGVTKYSGVDGLNFVGAVDAGSDVVSSGKSGFRRRIGPRGINGCCDVQPTYENGHGQPGNHACRTDQRGPHHRGVASRFHHAARTDRRGLRRRLGKRGRSGARPLNTLSLKGVTVPPVASRLGRTEQEVCLKNGVTPLEAGPGDVVQIVRAVSTYTVNAEGVTDVSLLDITTIRTLDYVRKAIRERVSLRFPREKLSTRTPPKVRSEILDVLRGLESLEIVEEVDANADGVVVERDIQDANRLNAKIPTDVVNGLHVFAGRIDLLL